MPPEAESSGRQQQTSPENIIPEILEYVAEVQSKDELADSQENKLREARWGWTLDVSLYPAS